MLIRIAAATMLFVGTIASAGQSPPQSSESSQQLEQAAVAGLDEQIRRVVAEWKVPGVSVAVVRSGRIVFSGGYGVRSPRTKLPMTEDTLFPIASMTKPFTSFGVGLLVDDGKLSLDRPVNSYLPELHFKDPAVTQGLTLRDMLSHRSGMPRHDAIPWHNERLTRDELAARMAFLDFSEPLRSTFQYNNNMFTLAGLAIARVSGISWEQFTERRILGPLGMKRTTFSYERALADPDHIDGIELRNGHAVTIPLLRRTPVLRPAGGLYSTARELATWLMIHLHGGEFGSKKVIEASTLAELHKAQIARGATTREPERIQVGYGLGWFTDVYRGQPLVHHGGNLPGVSTMGAMLPAEGLGVVVLVNQGGSELRDALTYAIFDRFLGMKGRDWLGEALKRKRAAETEDASGRGNKSANRIPNTQPSHPLGDFAGAYTHPGYGSLTVEQGPNGLLATYNSDQSQFKHVHYDIFDATTDDPEHSLVDVRLQFVMDVYGRISAVESALEPAVAPIRFLKEPDARLRDPLYLSRLTGTYQLGGNKVVIAFAGDQLTWTTIGGQPAQLIPALGGEFTHSRRKDARIAFTLPSSGKASAFHLIDATGAFEAKWVGE